MWVSFSLRNSIYLRLTFALKAQYPSSVLSFDLKVSLLSLRSVSHGLPQTGGQYKSGKVRVWWCLTFGSPLRVRLTLGSIRKETLRHVGSYQLRPGSGGGHSYFQDQIQLSGNVVTRCEPWVMWFLKKQFCINGLLDFFVFWFLISCGHVFSFGLVYKGIT